MLLKLRPEIIFAGFSRLPPDGHIRAHRDEKPDTILRAHLALRTAPGATIRVAGDESGWRDGETLAFDGALEHEVWNRASSPRLVLLLDFLLSPPELAYVLERRAAVEPETPR